MFTLILSGEEVDYYFVLDFGFEMRRGVTLHSAAILAEVCTEVWSK